MLAERPIAAAAPASRAAATAAEAFAAVSSPELFTVTMSITGGRRRTARAVAVAPGAIVGTVGLWATACIESRAAPRSRRAVRRRTAQDRRESTAPACIGREPDRPWRRELATVLPPWQMTFRPRRDWGRSGSGVGSGCRQRPGRRAHAPTGPARRDARHRHRSVPVPVRPHARPRRAAGHVGRAGSGYRDRRPGPRRRPRHAAARFRQVDLRHGPRPFRRRPTVRVEGRDGRRSRSPLSRNSTSATGWASPAP